MQLRLSRFYHRPIQGKFALVNSSSTGLVLVAGGQQAENRHGDEGIQFHSENNDFFAKVEAF
jgi:hypothetical protein